VEFKQALLEIAQGVAEAASEGFLGFGPRVSDRERRMLDRIREVLGQ